jgi:two-component system nitrate/nitrite response regulator NarL
VPDPATLRLVLVDDHPLFVRGIELLLPASTEGRARVVASTGDAAGAAGVVLQHRPDLVLVDLRMPPPGGIRAIAAIRRTTPRVRVVAISGLDDIDLMTRAMRAGADGYLPKSSEPEEILPPLLAVLNGWAVLPPGLLTALLGTPRAGPPPTAVLDDGERRLLRLIAKGRRTVEIAEELHLSERTVKRMTAALLRKLRVSNRTEAAALAGTAGLM